MKAHGWLKLGIAAAMIFVWAGPAAAVTDAEKCEAAKVKAVGKKAQCLTKERAKEVKGGTPDYGKCSTKFTAKFADAETKAGAGVCPTEGDAAAIEAQVDANGAIMTARLHGVRFVDNGDGTVSDTQTGLMWEMKDALGLGANLGDPHDADNTYTWADALSEWLSLVNGYSADGTAQTGLGGHSDWRLPNNAELQTIVDLTAPGCGSGSPCINSTFGPTVASNYWSSTTYSGNPTYAGDVYFTLGNVVIDGKTNTYYVRAVRGGS